MSRWIIAVGGLLALVYVALPYGRFASALYVIVTTLSASAIALAVYRRPLFRPVAWSLVAAAITLVAIGHGIWYWLDLRGFDPFPSVADVFYLAVYPLFFAALRMLDTPVGRHDGALADALIVGISAAVLGWALLIEPYMHDPALSLDQLLVSAAYPVADLILLPLILRLVFLRRNPNKADVYLLAGMLAYLTADILYAHGNSTGWYAPGGLTDAWWLVAYALFTAAVWHDSATREPMAQPASDELTIRRLYVLGLASVLVPTVILLTAGTDVEIVRVAAIGAILLFLLLMQRMAGLVRRTRRQSRALERLSLTDPLTGAANRRSLDQSLYHEMTRAERDQSPLSLAFLDLDHFKRFNDRHGHTAGDALLKELVARWRDELRPMDVLARFGGEEFVVVLPQTGIDKSRRVVERLREQVPHGQTCSAGVTRYRPGESADQLLTRADGALYEAKKGGRDRVVCIDAGSAAG